MPVIRSVSGFILALSVLILPSVAADAEGLTVSGGNIFWVNGSEFIREVSNVPDGKIGLFGAVSYVTSLHGPLLDLDGTVVVSSETITVAPVPDQPANAPFTVSGTIANASSVPTLEYQDDSGAWLSFPPTGGVRNPYNFPGGQGSAWVTPIGANATFGAASDPDTIDIARGWNGSSFTTGPVGIINSFENFGAARYVGSVGDPQVTFSGSSNGREGANVDNSSPLVAKLHIPLGAAAPGPYPGDNPFVLLDPVNQPNRIYTFGGVSLTPPGAVAGMGQVNGSSGEWDDITSDSFGEDADTGLDGRNIGPGLITGCDTDPGCNPDYPAIKHALRYSTDAHLLKDNAVVPGQQLLKPDSWPQRLQDMQSGIDLYTGNLKAGTTLAIPSRTAMPASLNANCRGAFWSMQHYPLFFRDQAGGGMHLSADQVADKSHWVTDVRSCLPQLVALLRPMRNQHQTGQDFAAFPKNGPGARLDSGPLPLVSNSRGFVTQTSFSFVHPAMAAEAPHVVAVRDAANTSASGSSNPFAVDALASRVSRP